VKKFYNFLYKLKVEFRNIFYMPIIKYKISDNLNYDMYWDIRNKSERKNPHILHEYRAKLLYDFILENNLSLNSNILDIGSGDGRQLKAIQNIMDKLSITASDISMKSIEILSEDFETININLDKNFVTKDYKIITAFEVLEHLEKPEEDLMYFLSKTDYAFIFSVPNTGYFFHRLRLFFGSFPMQWKSFPGEHLRFWTYKDMEWWLSCYLGLNKNKYKIICYAYLFPFLKNIFPFNLPLFAKGLFIQINKN